MNVKSLNTKLACSSMISLNDESDKWENTDKSIKTFPSKLLLK